MTLRTLDEARHSIARSALRLIERCDSTDPQLIAAMLHGACVATTSSHDQLLARRHRRILDHVTVLGYGGEARDELDSITTTLGVDP
jgi:hypothetical protein